MKKHLLIFLLLATLAPWAVQAQTKTHIASTSSSTQMTWAEFAQNVNNGITYEGQTVYLDSNVTATTRAGYATNSDTKSFHGTFDGQGHTITFNFTADNTYAAPFACVKNATFLNLKTTGTITANTKRYAGGIAGMVISGSQNCTFTNCESNVTITSTSNGTDDCRHGGFVANVVGGNVTFNGCAFTGGFSGTNAKGWGGFVGYFNHYVYFTDCIFSPTSISINNQNNSTFARPSGTQVITFTNCYYTQSLGGSQGKQRYTVTAESPATVAMNGTATYHNVSHITAYSDNQGLVYNGTIVAGEGDNVSLNLGGGDFYMASPGTITGNGNPYTLAMEAQNTIISIPKTHIASTSSDTQMTWAEFAQNVNNGTTYEGQTIYLDADVTATTMAGTNETNCFKGTFEGQGHTLTFNYTASGSYYTAPFHYLNGATIQNLKVSGTITANYARCGGLAGNCYGTNAIINCLSNITINSTVNGDGTHGGFISRVYRGTTTFEGCTFAGSLLGENTTANGGFVGWSEGNNNYAFVSFSNCVYAPVANTTNPSAGATFARGRNNSTTGITISNCFYTSSEFQYTQGKQAYTITGQSPVSMTMNGTATYHNVSRIKAYSGNTGLDYNGTIVAGEDDIVSLNLGGALSFNADHGTLTGTANPYTLSMEAYNTTISAVTPLELETITIGQLDSYYYTMETTLAGRYGYNYSVYIYKPEDSDFLNFDFDLASLAFNVTRATSTPIAEMTLWVKDVDADFLTIRYWTFSEYIDGATQVYDSQAAFAATTGWNTFNLTTNFSHEGGKALLVAVRSVGTNLAGSGSTNNWNSCSYTTKTRSHWCKCANNTDPGTAVDGDWDVYDKRADIQLGVTYTSATCFIPSDLTVAYSAGTDTEVTLGWTENGEATAWQICLNDDEDNLIDANTNPFTLTGLTPETLYFAKVRANCGDLHSNWSDAAIIQPTLKTVIGMYDAVDVGYLPTNIFANYSMTEQIYTADELGEAGSISSIDFFNNSAGTASRNLQIYMKHCDVSSLSSNPWADWINITADDLVFSGTVDFASKAWTSITLDTPLDYNGTQNVVLKVADNTGIGSGQIYFLNNTNPEQILRARGVHGDQIYDPTDPTPYQYASPTTNRNYIRIGKTKTPTNLTAFNNTSDGTTLLNWTENGTATTWQICLNGDMNNLIDVTENSYTLTGLTPNTPYTAKVRSTYDNCRTAWSNEVSFTPHTGIMVYCRENFDSYPNVNYITTLPPGWTTINTNNTDFPRICDYGINNPDLWVSASGGLWFYVAPEDNNDIYAIMPSMNTAGVQVTMYLGKCGDFTVGLMTDPTDINTFTACSQTYVRVSNTPRQLVHCTLMGQGNYIAIKYNKNASETGGFIDNVYVQDYAPITVSDSTLAIADLPISNDLPLGWVNSYTKQIYTTDELGEAGIIRSIGFLKTDTVSASFNLDIYMVNTDKQDNPRPIPYSIDDRVFSGTVDFLGIGWHNIPLDIPFRYDGEHNVCLIVDSHTVKRMNFQCITTASLQAYNSITYQAHDSIWDDYYYHKNILMFTKTEIMDVCTNLSATTLYYSADLSWDGVEGAQSYTVRYMPAESSGEWQTATTTQTSLHLTGLDIGTEYKAQVRSNLPDELWSYTARFNTQGSPTGLQCTSVSPNSATLSWPGNFTPTVWQICIDGDENNLIEVTEKPYTLTGLTPMTSYTAKVRGIAGAEISDWGNEIVINTAQEPVSLPYSTDFETASDWYLINGDLTNAWVWGEAVNNGEGTHSLYISNDGGATHAFDNSKATCVYALKAFDFEAGVYDITFDWMANGEVVDAYMYVALIPANQNMVADTWRPDSNYGWINIGYRYTGTTVWQTAHYEVPVSSPGTYNLAFIWINRESQSPDPPAAIDNLSIAVCECPQPLRLTVNVAERTNTAVLSWTEMGEATQWQVCLDGDEDNLIDVCTNPCSLTGLAFESQHTVKVRANCGESQSAWSNTRSFEVTQSIKIGTPSASHERLPFDNLYNYSLTQQVYFAEEFGDAGLIMGIDFQKETDIECVRNLDIYMVHTDKSEFESTTDWIQVTDADLVFSGTVDFVFNDWTHITLDTPFNYDGQHNVALIVDDNTGSCENYWTYFACTYVRIPNFYTETKVSMFYYNDNTNYDPTGTPGEARDRTNLRNHIRLWKGVNLTKEIAGYGTGDGNWSLVASPFVVATNPEDVTNMLSNEFDLYRFNPAVELEWENWKDSITDHYHFNLESGRGYLYANNGDVTLSFFGVPYVDNGQVTLSKDEDAPLGEWNLIGNPYATAATIGDKPFYVMNDLGTEIIAAENDTIAAMEGIFVQANTNGETVTFTPVSTGAKRGESEKEIVLNLVGPSTLRQAQGSGTGSTTASVIDRAIIRFGEGEALPKMQIRGNSSKVYIPQDGKEYAVACVGRDVSRNVSTTEIPVNFEAAEDGTYTLTVDTEGINLEYLHLFDNMTGTDIDLLAGCKDAPWHVSTAPTYTFEAQTTDDASRFRLVFSANGE